jgi:methionyl-tRNA formyltransferase
VRVALFTRLPEVAVFYDARLRELGHECVGVVTAHGPAGRYGDEPLGALVEAAPRHLDVLVANEPSRFAALLAALEPDVAVSGGFPLRIPAEALRVPRHGVVNGHPSLLPRLRGPNPIGWALRNGDERIGFTFHRMDENFDTGALLAQGSAPLADAEGPSDVVGRMIGLAGSLLGTALARVEAGDPGDVQDESQAGYAGFFDPEYAEIDWSRPAEEVHRQVRAWWVAAVREGPRGALAELDGTRVRVLRTRLDGDEGGVRVECGDGPIWVLETAPSDELSGPH